MTDRPQPPGVPVELRVAAGWAWRLLLIGAVVVLTAWALAEVRLVVVPLVVALLATALLHPVAARLRRRGLPRAAAAALVVGVAVGLTALLVALVVPPVVDEFDSLGASVSSGIEQVTDWVTGTDEHAPRGERIADDVADAVRDNAERLGRGAVAGALIVAEILVGGLLAIVLTFFLLKDGDRMWAAALETLSDGSRSRAEELGQRVWAALRAYVRGLVVVAAFDAVFIALALWLIGVPLVLVLAVLTFVGAFVPIVGAWVAGAAAALVALVALGVEEMILVVVATIIVQQVESNVLHPLVMGRALRLHPMVILLAVTAGAVLGGIVGAALAAPIAAVLVICGRYWREQYTPAAEPGAIADAHRPPRARPAHDPAR